MHVQYPKNKISSKRAVTFSQRLTEQDSLGFFPVKNTAQNILLLQSTVILKNACVNVRKKKTPGAPQHVI